MTVYPHLQCCVKIDQKHWNCGFASSFEPHETYRTSTDCMLFIDFVRAGRAHSRHHVALINRNKITVHCWSMTHHKHKCTHTQTHPGCEQQWHWRLYSGITGIEGHRDADAETMDGITPVINYQIPFMSTKHPACQEIRWYTIFIDFDRMA